MSNRHPNNGPSFSAPTYNWASPLRLNANRRSYNRRRATLQNKSASGRCCAMTQKRGPKNISKKELGRLGWIEKEEDQMWIMANNSYLSIVSKDCGPAELLVRARRAGDIEKVFPDAKVIRNTNSDYLYRAVLPRDVVKQALAAMIDHIDYQNFKDSVEDRSLHAAYVGVWCAMAGLQHPPPDIERATHARSALTSKNTL